jgi:hypothetical protein
VFRKAYRWQIEGDTSPRRSGDKVVDLKPAQDLRRLVGVAGFLARSAGSPSGRTGVLRRLGAHALDLEFEANSPFPTLAESFLARTSNELVVLPPTQLLEPGNQSFNGLMRLVAIARAVSARRIFEIGTYNGLTAMILAANLPEARIETLDLPPGRSPGLPVLDADLLNAIPFERRVYEGTPYASRIVQHFGDSAVFDFRALGESFDLVYIDGAHSWAYVDNDTKAALSIVRDNGVVVWDDYWRLIPDVAAYLHTLSSERMHRIEGTRLVVRLGLHGQHDSRS